MRHAGWLVAGVFWLCAMACGQAQNVPGGTAIPFMLNSDLNSGRSKPGQAIEGKVMQDVPLPTGATIGARSKVTGHVVAVVPGGAEGARISVKFDQIEDHGTIYKLMAGARAVASSQDVSQAGQPIDSASSYESASQWTTQQVGGEFVNRSQGKVGTAKGYVVGRWKDGVWAELEPEPDAGCPENNNREQSLWVFSTIACGLYGWEHLHLEHSGMTDPIGEIVLSSEKKIEMRGGSGWLLLTTESAPAGK